MARVGTGNFVHSLMGAVTSDTYWRESVEREGWRHRYHPLNLAQPRPTMGSLTTTTKEFTDRTWRTLQHTYSFAAGKSSYHHNIRRPLGNPTHPSLTSANSELPGKGLSNSEFVAKESPLLTMGRHVMSDPNLSIVHPGTVQMDLYNPHGDALKRDTRPASNPPNARSPGLSQTGAAAVSVLQDALGPNPRSVRSGQSRRSSHSRLA
eukprot:gnl/MRDRNA2_/MRDRNA2_54891_c0_seq1.p1 gnl/MRDRNA2_/MRDRNA2_54891_c0~~gnl/MRDRNA2_/MRDRNA2_54891_c0_seq1.p1  ORF type:complete len:207 (+),score=14.84 gnl/MRDRNA2_/MRDRNA2_54891_c0_seq1:96-716(+)